MGGSDKGTDGAKIKLTEDSNKVAAETKAADGKELKPSAQLVEAVPQSVITVPGTSSSEAPSASPPCELRARLLQEESRELVKGAVPLESGRPSHQEKKWMHDEMKALQGKGAPTYDRSHAGAGKAGKGDQAMNSAMGVSREYKGPK